jgi:TolA-binding protein
MGNISFNQKDYAEALDYFDTFIDQYPDDALVPDAYFNAGRCYYKLEYYSKAIEEWEKLIAHYKSHPRSQEAVGIIADTYFRAQKYPQAIHAYQRALADYPGTSMAREAQLRIAQSYFNANDNLTAIAEFEKFIRQFGDDPLTNTALDGIIMASYKLGQSSTEEDIDIQVMQRLLEKYPGTKFAAVVQYRLAERYYEKKDFSRAAAVFRKAYTNFFIGENAAGALFYLAESLYQNAQYEDASTVYRRFIDNYAQHEYIPLSYLHLANSLYYLKRYDEAGKVYVHLTHLSPVDDELAVTALHNAAVCFRKLENWDQVVLINKRFIELFPHSDKVNDVLLELAETYESLTQYDMAIAVYEQLLGKLTGKDALIPEMHFRVAQLYYKESTPEKAVAELQKIISLEPKDNPWRLSGMVKLAQEYEHSKELDQAMDIYRQLVNSTKEAKWISIGEERIAALENQLKIKTESTSN